MEYLALGKRNSGIKEKDNGTDFDKNIKFLTIKKSDKKVTLEDADDKSSLGNLTFKSFESKMKTQFYDHFNHQLH